VIANKGFHPISAELKGDKPKLFPALRQGTVKVTAQGYPFLRLNPMKPTLREPGGWPTRGAAFRSGRA